MRIQLVSDVHTEFHPDRGTAWLNNMDAAGVDVLVVAGDLTLEPWIPSVLSALCDRYPAVVYVTGNHEYYKSSRQRIHLLLTELCKHLPNLHWLNDGSVEIDGQRFVGGTLWFSLVGDGRDAPLERCLGDFQQIDGFREWVYAANADCMDYLARTVQPTDVVVTHHLPHPSAVDAQWKRPPYDQLNRFFLCDMSELIDRAQPRLWCFGHTHSSVDMHVGDTRLLCNPHGYPSEGKLDYQDKLTVDL